MRLKIATIPATEPVKSFAEVASALAAWLKGTVETSAVFQRASREPEEWVKHAIQEAYYTFTKDVVLNFQGWNDGTWKSLTRRTPNAYSAHGWASKFADGYSESVFEAVDKKSAKRSDGIEMTEDEKRRLQPILQEIILTKTTAGFTFHDEAVVFFLNGVIRDAREIAGLDVKSTHKVIRYGGHLSKEQAETLLSDAQGDEPFRKLYERDFRDSNGGSVAHINFLADFSKPKGYRPPRASLDAEYKKAIEDERAAPKKTASAAPVTPVAPNTPTETAKPEPTKPAPAAAATLENALKMVQHAATLMSGLGVFHRRSSSDSDFRKRLWANLDASATIQPAVKKGKDGIKKITGSRAKVEDILSELVESNRVPLMAVIAAASKILRCQAFVDRLLQLRAVLEDHAKSKMTDKRDTAELAKRIAKINAIYNDFLTEKTEVNVFMSPALSARLKELDTEIAVGYPSARAASSEQTPAAKPKKAASNKTPAKKPAAKKATAKKPAEAAAAKKKASAKKATGKKTAKSADKKPAAKKKAKADKKAAPKSPAKKKAKADKKAPAKKKSTAKKK